VYRPTFGRAAGGNRTDRSRQHPAMGCVRCGEAAFTVELVIDGVPWLLELCEWHLDEALEGARRVRAPIHTSRPGPARPRVRHRPEPVGP
jgi:hypothetical protein